MKSEDVTDTMVERLGSTVDLGYDGESSAAEIIAAAFNAVVSDDSPITAEWLLANGWYCACPLSKSYRHKQMESLFAWFCDGQLADVAIGDVSLPTKTIGQLRALHAGLGLGEVGNG